MNSAFINHCFSFLLAGLTVGNLWSQPPANISSIDWTYPVKHPLRLSGTFGELRSNHFHTGIDIKSNSPGASGDPIYAVDDGYIVGIAISSGGYGKVLFIHHPIYGITSTYAHLDRFTPGLDSIVQQKQYDERQFEVTCNFPVRTLPVQKGELIAYMGNTGHSSGPHLHFEVRDDSSGLAINPLHYQKVMHDRHAPVLKSIRVYYLDQHHRPYKWTDINGNELRSKNSDTLIIPSWRIGFGVETFDPHNGGSNRNGIYHLSVKEDGQEIHVFRMDTLHFNESNYLNAHIDFKEFQSSGRRIHKTFQQPGNKLSIYCSHSASSVVAIHRQLAKKIEIAVSDFHGNTQSQTLWVRRAEEVAPPDDLIYHYRLSWDKRNLIERENIILDFPPESLYEDLYLFFRKSPPIPGKTTSPVYTIHNTDVPLHKSFQLEMTTTSDSNKMRRKTVIGKISEEGNVSIYKTTVNDSICAASVSSLGDYAILIDTLGPKITTLSEIVHNSAFRFRYRVSDNFSRADGPDFTYEAYLDNEWILMEFDGKSGRLEVKRNNLPAGKHTLKLILSDMVGNTTIYNKDFNVP